MPELLQVFCSKQKGGGGHEKKQHWNFFSLPWSCLFPVLFDKIHGVYENHLQNSGRRGPYLHTGYILYQLLRLLGKDVKAEEFNTLSNTVRNTSANGVSAKNIGTGHHKRRHLVPGVQRIGVEVPPNRLRCHRISLTLMGRISSAMLTFFLSLAFS